MTSTAGQVFRIPLLRLWRGGDRKELPLSMHGLSIVQVENIFPCSSFQREIREGHLIDCHSHYNSTYW